FEAQGLVQARALPTVRTARRFRDLVRGVALDDRELREGLAVAAELAPHHAALAAQRLWPRVIDVSPCVRGGAALTWVELRLDRGPPIEWGRACATSPLGRLEPAPETKVNGLLKLATNHPDLAGIQRVRLQFATPSIVIEDAPSS